MPNAALRPCAGNCGARVQRGRCEKCARPSASKRGYDRAWERFRERYIRQLVELGITPCCGARLPTGPQTQDSWCWARGSRAVIASPHLDHEPPLEEWERTIPSQRDDERRVQILCADCHRAKTQRQTTGGRIDVRF